MINEDGAAVAAPAGTTTADMAQFTPRLGGVSKRGLPVFDIDTADEFHSFAKGQKKFREWKKHTKSQEIRQWANKNYGKSFMVHHNGNYMTVNRTRKQDIKECFDMSEQYKLLVEAVDYDNKEGFFKSVKDIAKKLYDALTSNHWEVMGMYEDMLKRALSQGVKFLDDVIKKHLEKVEQKKWKDSVVLDFSYFLAKEYKYT